MQWCRLENRVEDGRKIGRQSSQRKTRNVLPSACAIAECLGVQTFHLPGPRQMSFEAKRDDMKNPILSLPLTAVMREEIALPLQVMQIYTVGGFLKAWRSPKNHKMIEQLFDSPAQARHAAATCAGWLGVRTRAEHQAVGGWWKDEAPPMSVGQA